MSLYLDDINSLTAHLAVRKLSAVLPLTLFGEFELTNAIRAAVVRRVITVPEAEQTLGLVRQEASTNRLIRTPCNMEAALRAASSLSQQHTYADGYRALDVMHVAIAIVLGCTDFLTFDQRQARLAQQAGMNTPARSDYSRRKFSSSRLPSAVRMLSGWNCTPWIGNSRCRRPMISPSAVRALTTRQSGTLSGRTTSEW